MDKRKNYWENYINYWQERVADSNNARQNADKMPDDRILHNYLEILRDSVDSLDTSLPLSMTEKSLSMTKQSLSMTKQSLKTTKESNKPTFLDYGCGFGRAFTKAKELKFDYHGVDIATSCINACKKSYPQIKAKTLLENDKIPYKDDFFNAVFCYGVFDACFQHITLAEILRVLKVGGVALISGKNDDYLPSDELALNAEIGARNNNHPNFFTNFNLMQELLESSNIKILQARYFINRADSASDTFTLQKPKNFYSWIVLVQKLESKKYEFSNFSDSFSKTFKRLQESKLRF